MKINVREEEDKEANREEVEAERQGLSTPQKNMHEFIDEVKDGPWFT